MVQPNVASHIANERSGQTGGVSERMLHHSSGLRGSPLTLELQSDDQEIMTGILLPTDPVALGEVDPLTGENISLIDNERYGGGVVTGATIRNNGILSWPSSLCLSYFFTLTLSSPRNITWRVRGTDHLGNRIEEVQTVTAENGLEAFQTDATDTNDVEAAYCFRLWTSNIFASVDSIELAKPDTVAPGDNIRIGTCYKWDRADSQVVIYNDGTSGDFTLTLTATVDGVVETDTTAALADDVSPALLRTALLGLSLGALTIDDVQVTSVVALIGPVIFDNIRIIRFLNPILGRVNVSIDDTGLSGPNSNTAIISGEDWHNRDGAGIAAPLELLPAGPAGASGNLYPEIIAAQLTVPHKRTQFITHDILSTTDAGDLVTLATPHGFLVGESFVAIIENATALTPAVNLVVVGTATTDVSFDVTQNISTIGALGTVTILGAVYARVGGTAGLESDPYGSTVALQDAAGVGGTRSVPTAAGFRVGINEASVPGGRYSGGTSEDNKFMIFMDGGQDAKLALRDGRPVSINHRNLERFGLPHTIKFWTRSTKGTGRMASDVRTYPQG